jgi:hypothetical protein
MKISELPSDVKAKALEYQKNASDTWNKETDDLLNAFDWSKTREGFDYWNEWDLKEYNLLDQLTELRKQYPNDFDFGREVAKLIQL